MQIEHLVEYDSIEYRQMTDLYKSAFPLEERAPIEIMDARFKAKGHSIYIAKQQVENQEKLIAFAIVYPFHNPNLLLLDYFAVDPTFRGQGIGSEFLLNLFQHLQLLKEKKRLLIEVDDPRFGQDVEIRKKRVQFYKRLGCMEIDAVRYYLPSFAGRVPIEMILMIYPQLDLEDFTNQQLKRVIEELYITKYHQNPELPLLKEILASIPSKLRFI